jgi:hypothetical protein
VTQPSPAPRWWANPRPLTALFAVILALLVCVLALALGYLVITVLSSNMRHTEQLAAANRLVSTSSGDVVNKLAEATQELVKVQAQMVEQQRLAVEIQNRVTAFSDEQIKARRAQGVRARTLKLLCETGDLKGKSCEGIPDPDLLELLDR